MGRGSRDARIPAGGRMGDEEVRRVGAGEHPPGALGFGKGWSLVRFSAHMVEPQVQPLIGFPKAWSSGTKGEVTADVVRARSRAKPISQKYHGTLAGKIVLTQPARRVRMLEGPFILRMDRRRWRRPRRRRFRHRARRGRRGAATLRSSAAELEKFYEDEGVVATFDRGGDNDMAAGGSDLSWQQQHTDGGTIFPRAASRATRTPARACRRSRSRSSTTTAWCACSTRACR